MKLHAKSALLVDGWAEDVLLEVDDAGFIQALRPDCAGIPDDAETLTGPVLAGMPNVHSHAFQRAMAGLTERRGPGEDSFWTWRERMYDFVSRITPEQVQCIAAQLYVDMLKAGYTSVGEFHYLHHQPDGSAYETPSEMSDRVIAAATETGIAITHLAVLYACNGFGGKAPDPAQRRFVHDSDGFARLLEDLHARYRSEPLVRIGMAPHSLRAVTREQLAHAVGSLERLDVMAPIHIHIAEQIREVDECLEWSGHRPVEWLLGSTEVDERWCLVHATHVSDRELERVAESRAVVGLCPTTEANLGDGVFPASDFLDCEGRFAIGSDSHVSVSPMEELRLLEYGQRLTYRQRALLAGPDTPSVGRTLYDASLAGGAQALNQPVGSLGVGRRADLVVLDGDATVLAHRRDDAILDSFIFASTSNLVKDVMVSGRWRIRDARHDHEEAIAVRFKSTLSELLTE
jgi:formimidoylglutamate deiminase